MNIYELTEKEILECVKDIDLDYREGLIKFAKEILNKIREKNDRLL